MDGNGVSGSEKTGGNRSSCGNVSDRRNIRVMGPGALRNNIRVKHVTLPDVYSVEMQAFYNCTSLRSVSFPKLRSVKGGVQRLQPSEGGCFAEKRQSCRESSIL